MKTTKAVRLSDNFVGVEIIGNKFDKKGGKQ